MFETKVTPFLLVTQKSKNFQNLKKKNISNGEERVTHWTRTVFLSRLSVLDRYLYIFDGNNMCENKLFYFRNEETAGKG